jgi:hypothetical protein
MPTKPNASIASHEVVSFLVAPIAPSLIFGVVHPISPDLGGILRATMVMLISSFAVVILLGLPIFLWFRRRGWVSWYHALSGGSLAMVLPVAFLGFWEASAVVLRDSAGHLIREGGEFTEQGQYFLLLDLVQLICLGGSGGLCFWAVCRRG